MIKRRYANSILAITLVFTLLYQDLAWGRTKGGGILTAVGVHFSLSPTQNGLRPVAREERKLPRRHVEPISHGFYREHPSSQPGLPDRLPESPRILSIGDELTSSSGKRFVIIDAISHGSYGDTYKAYEAGARDNKVAIKITRSNNAEIIRREKAFYKKTRHENMPAFVDSGEREGCEWIAIEWVEGERLDKWWENNKNPIEMLIVFKQLFGFLSFMHQNGYLHNDIKPSNILILPGAKIKVVDFGTTCKQDKLFWGKRGVVGTPRYMAPEMITDNQNITQQADIYSAGAVLYELVTGKRFRKEDALMDALIEAVRQPSPTASDIANTEGFKSVWGEFPGIAEIIAKMVKYERPQRYATAKEVQGDIDGLIISSPEASEHIAPTGLAAVTKIVVKAVTKIVVKSEKEREEQLQTCI